MTFLVDSPVIDPLGSRTADFYDADGRPSNIDVAGKMRDI